MTQNSWNSSDPAQVARGGTGLATLTDNSVLLGSGTAPITPLTNGTTGQVLTANTGADPSWGPAPGSGDVVGPASSTDNALARYNSTTGKLIQDSTVLVTDNGEMNNASQPSFLAYLPSSDSNVTGDGTKFYIGDTDVGTSLTEVFDQNSDFTPGASGGAIFTAPVAGKYAFTCKMYVIGATTLTSGQILLETSNRNFRRNYLTGYPTTTWDNLTVVYTDLDAADTVLFSVITIDSGGKIDDISGSGTNNQTFMSGFLVC